METIRFGKSTGVIIFLILLVVIFIILVSWKNSRQNNPDENRLDRMLKRWRELTDQIEEELRTLKLTQEMKIFVEKKILQLFKLSKAVFSLMFVLVAVSIYRQSNEIISSIIDTTELFIFICCACSFFLSNRFTESNSIIKSASMCIRKWVYRRYGYDPSEEKLLELSINEKKTEANSLRVEISQLNASHNFVNK